MNEKKPFLLLHYYYPPLAGAVTKRVEHLVKYIGKVSSYQPVAVTSTPRLIHFGYDYDKLREVLPLASVYYTFSLDPLYLLSRLVQREKKRKLQPVKNLPFSRLGHNMYTFWKNVFFIGDDKTVLWTPFVIRRFSQLRKRYSFRFIYSTFPPVGNLYAAYWLKKIYNVPLILDYRDPWFYNYSALRYKTSCHFFLESICERKILRGADGIIFNSPVTREKYLHVYPFLEEKPTSVIVNGYEPLEVGKEKPQKPTGQDSKITFIASGNMLRERSLKPFLQTLQELIRQGKVSQGEVKCHICGIIDPSMEKLLQNDSSFRSSVQYLGNLTHAKAIKAIDEADVAVACFDNVSRSDIILNKLFDYMSKEKFILFIGNSRASTRLLKDYGKCACFDTDERENLHRFLLRLIKKPETVLKKPVRISSARYRVDTLMKEMGGFFDEVLSNKIY